MHSPVEVFHVCLVWTNTAARLHTNTQHGCGATVGPGAASTSRLRRVAAGWTTEMATWASRLGLESQFYDFLTRLNQIKKRLGLDSTPLT